RDLGAHALHELVEGRPRRERLHELLVVEDLVADRGQLLLRQIEERTSLELLGVDPVGNLLERYAALAERAHEAVRVHRRLGQGGGLAAHSDALAIPTLPA